MRFASSLVLGSTCAFMDLQTEGFFVGILGFKLWGALLVTPYTWACSFGELTFVLRTGTFSAWI